MINHESTMNLPTCCDCDDKTLTKSDFASSSQFNQPSNDRRRQECAAIMNANCLPNEDSAISYEIIDSDNIGECPICMDTKMNLSNGQMYPCCGAIVCQTCARNYRATFKISTEAKWMCPYCRSGDLTEEEATNCHIVRAKKGNSEACYKMGHNYRTGDNGFVQNKELAVVWYKKAALQGNIRAMFNLGVCYSNGIDGPITDWNIAAMYFKMAADHGCGRSAYAYGSILLKDNGPLEKNVPRAVSYLKMAADRGCAESALKYGLALLNGWGLDTDIKAAALYLKLAAERGNPHAAKCYAALLTQCFQTWTRVTMNANRKY